MLVKHLAALGYAPEDIQHALVTHIHLDHAGAAGRFAEHGAKIYVHPRGVKHLRDPSRLLASARRIFGRRTEELWGRPTAVAADRIQEVEDGEALHLGGVEIEALETPGHADHHLTWKIGDSIFTGDAGGVRIGKGPVISPTPPPEIRVEAWQRSIARLRSLRAEEIYLSHFGRFTDVEEHLEGLESCLLDWSAWIGTRLNKEESQKAIVTKFGDYVTTGLIRAGLGPAELREYEIADPAWMNAQGLIRFWRKRRNDSGTIKDRR